MARRRVLTDSPFDTLEKTFDLLVSGPHPLALDGTGIAGLPNRSIPLDELKAMLLHPSMPFALRDAIVDELVAHSRNLGRAWTIGLAGVLLPGLRRAAWPLVQACPGKADDIEAETLAAFLAAVARCEPGRARLASRLCWLARSGATRLMRAELAERGRPGSDPVSAAPPRPWGHPDLVLARAVRAGVISAADAELIGATRVGDVDLAEVANALGISYKACHQRRLRAESALVEWLTSDGYSPFEFVEKRAETPCSSRGGRPRQGRSTDRRPDKRRSNQPPRR
jgi:DNA-directed RNA polymerase specialized sigma24 family protein